MTPVTGAGSGDLTEVFAGIVPGGPRWSVVTKWVEPGNLVTLLRTEREGRGDSGGFGGPPLPTGESVSASVNRGDDGRSSILLRAAPDVQAVDVRLSGGSVIHASLSPVVPSFGLRFGVAFLPDNVAADELMVRLLDGGASVHPLPRLDAVGLTSSASGGEWVPDPRPSGRSAS